MTTLSNTFEGGADGANFTSAAGGGASGTAPTLVTVSGATASAKFSTTGKAHGSLGLRVSVAGGTDLYRIRWDFAASPLGVVTVRFYLTLLAAITQAQDIAIGTQSNGAQAFKIGATAGGLIVLKNRTGATLSTLPTAPVVGQPYRFEVQATKGVAVAAPFDGQIAWQVYAGDSQANLISPAYSSAAVDVGVNPWIQLQIGENTAGRVFDGVFDDVKLSDESAAPLGGVANAAPTVTAPSNKDAAPGETVVLDFPASDPDSTFKRTTTFDYPTGGAAPAISNGTTQAPSFTVGNAGNLYIVRHTVTDDADPTVKAEAVVEIYVPVPGSTALKPLIGPGEGSVTWSNVGGLPTRGASLADDSDATYIESNTVTAAEQPRLFRLEPSQNRTEIKVLVKASQDAAGAIAGKIRLRTGADKVLRHTWEVPTAVQAGAIPEVTLTAPASVVSAILADGHFRQLYLETVAVL